MRKLLTAVAALALATTALGLGASPAHATVNITYQSIRTAVIGGGSCGATLLLDTTQYDNDTEDLVAEAYNANGSGCAYIGLRPNWTDCNGAVHLSSEIGVFNPARGEGPIWSATHLAICPDGSAQTFDSLLGSYNRTDDTTGHWNPTNSPNGFIDFVAAIPPPAYCVPADCFITNGG